MGLTTYLLTSERTLKAFDSNVASNSAACACLCHALSEYLSPPSLVIIRDEIKQMADWQNVISQTYYPHQLFLYLDKKINDLTVTLHRSVAPNVNAWICKGVEYLQSVNNLRDL